VSVKAWERAVEFTGQIERCVFRMLPTGMSAAGYDLQKIEDRIRRAGAQGLSRNDLTRAFQHMTPKDRDQNVQTLIEAGKIQSAHRPTATRQKLVYIHEDCIASNSSGAIRDEIVTDSGGGLGQGRTSSNTS
jgi:hypothetical protein